MLYRSILWSAHDEESLHKWFSSNFNVEVHAYVKNGKYCVVNNTYEPQSTVVYKGDGSSFALDMAGDGGDWKAGQAPRCEREARAMGARFKTEGITLKKGDLIMALTSNQHVLDWVKEMEELMTPDKTHLDRRFGRPAARPA